MPLIYLPTYPPTTDWIKCPWFLFVDKSRFYEVFSRVLLIQILKKFYMALSNQGTSSNSSCDMPPEENEDEVHIVLPSSKFKDQNPTRIPHGIVISGEASESDEEIDTHQALSQSASDFSISDAWVRSSIEHPEKEASKESSSVQYNTLLHKKLREKNQALRKDIVELVTQPYESASKEIHNISQQLIKSQLLVQELRNTIRRLTNDLFDMEDKMEALRTGSFLPDVSATPTSDDM